jgi:flavorubredoxin
VEVVMAKTLYSDETHRCIVFDDIMSDAGVVSGDVQSNQFLITHTSENNYEEGLIFDPGGSKLVAHLHQELARYIPTNRIKKIVLSHQDPDTGAGITQWLMMTSTTAKIYVSNLWVRFVPHFSRNDIKDEVFVAVPDQGLKIGLNGTYIYMVPAHFIHSPGNFHIYDPISKILFSGDLGTSLLPKTGVMNEVENFEEHIKHMEGFHRRYLSANRACRLWADMVRELDIEMIVPQHGTKYFKGKDMVRKFIDWIANLECGADILSDKYYKACGSAILEKAEV